MSFSRQARLAAKAALRASGDEVTYIRLVDGVSIPNIKALPEEDIEFVGEAGLVINQGRGFHLLVEDVPAVQRGDMLIEADKTHWEIGRELINDGYIVTVQAVPCVP